ncbi:MAG: hypothetical protein ACOY3I_09750 [Verrucomicrobiota bacterium]
MLSSRFWSILYFCAMLLIGASYLAWAASGYAMGEPDCLWFLPPAVSQHLGHGLYNFIHEPSHIFDPAGQNRFLFYPPGFQLFLSAFLIEPTGLGALLTLASLNFLSLFLFAILIYSLLSRASFTGYKFLLGLLSLLAFSTYLGGFRLGRPDFLATFYILLMIFIQRSTRAPLRAILSALLLGLIAFAHPVAALFTSALLGLDYAIRHPWKQTLMSLAGICGGGVAIFLIFMTASPHGWRDSFHGILLHAQNTMVDGTHHPFFKYAIMHTYATCYGLLFFAFLFVSVWMLWKRRRDLVWKRGVFIFSCVFLLFCYRFVGIAWDRCYNLWVIAPVILLALIVGLQKISENHRKHYAVALAVLLFLCSIGYLHTSLLFPYYLKYGYKYHDARKDFSQFLTENPLQIIGVSKSLWVLSEDYARMRSFGLNPAHLRSRPDWIVLQQRYMLVHTSEPPHFDGYTLVQHHFTSLKPKIFGLQLSSSMPGYFYAVYKKN